MFHVGQLVLCVDAKSGCGVWDGDAPVEGAIYTITSVHADAVCDVVVWLAEVERCKDAKLMWGPRVGYCAHRFRPLVERKTDIGIFTDILRKVEERKQNRVHA